MLYTRSVQKKSSYCPYNENGLHNIDVIWQPRTVDWNVHAWTMTTSLHLSVGVVDTAEWACALCGRRIQNDWVRRATNLHPILRLAWTFLQGNYSDDSEGCSYGQLVIGSFITTTHLLMHHIPFRVFWWNIKSLRWLSPSTDQIWCPVTSGCSQN